MLHIDPPRRGTKGSLCIETVPRSDPHPVNRREGRPGEKGILTSRVIDRPIRPLFPGDFRNDVSVMCTVMSMDHNCSAEIAALIGTKAEGSASFMVGTTEYAVPLGNLINVEEELKKLEADLKYNEGFLQSVLKKLSNEKFVSKAPANVIEMERKKQADAESKIASLKESIAALKK